MAHTTVLGHKVEFPVALIAKAARGERLSNTEVLTICQDFSQCHHAMLAIDYDLASKRAEIITLKRELDFMLRQINEQNQ